MIVIDHGVWQRYTPENAEVIDGRPVIYLRNEEGADFYRFLTFMEPGTCLVEVWTESGDVLNFTGDENAPDLTCHFPAGRRLLEVRPARTDLKGMRWDGVDFVPIPPPVPTRIAKADVWRRLSDEEAEAVDLALQASPLRLRRLFEAAQYLDTNDPDYPAVRAGVVAALGEARADEVLQPNY